MKTLQMRRSMFFLKPDDGGGSGGGGTPDPTTEPATLEEFLKGKPEADREALTKLWAKEAEGLKGALDKERQARETAERERKRIEKEHAKAAETKLEEQKQFEELAKQRETKLQELEPKVTDLETRLAAKETEAKEALDVVKELCDAQLKALKLDEATMELLAGKTPVETLKWLSKHQEKLGVKKSTLPETPGSNGNAKPTDEEARKLTARTW